jgi:hypothetical protein
LAVVVGAELRFPPAAISDVLVVDVEVLVVVAMDNLLLPYHSLLILQRNRKQIRVSLAPSQ